MRRLALATSAGLLLGASLLPLEGQILRPFRPGDDRPVPRANVVRPVTDDPLDADPRAATPVPIRRAQPVRPAATPAPAAPAAMPKIEPADPGEIHIGPQPGKTADQAQFDAADSLYMRKMYEMAASEYQRYLDQYPTAPDVQTALFRLAESYRKTGSDNAAKSTYDTLLSRFQNGDFVGPASYRLAEIYYQEKNYLFALPYFRKATVRIKEPAVATAAKFYTARSLESLGGSGNRLEAVDTYRELADAKEPNPFQEASRFSLALLLHEAGRLPEAIKQIKLLAAATQSPELKAEATVRAGVWQLETQPPQTAGAAEDLQKALSLPGLGKWKEVAEIGLVRMYYDSGKFKQVLDIYGEGSAQFSPDSRAELLLLAANSQRQLGKGPEALALYEQLLKDFPASPLAKDAAYQRLITLYNADDEKLIPAIDDYLTGVADPEKRDQVLLMKGESLYKKQNYPLAAPIYEAVAKSRLLTGTLRAEALFKLGFCEMQIRDFEKAVAAFTELIDGHPTFKSLTFAITQRAVAYQNLKNLAAAEKDYTLLIKKFPKAKERELALQQKAIIRGQLNDPAGMSENFELLLKEFPKTAAAAQARFWIGRSAFDQKDYQKAAAQLSEARTADREQFYERASLPLILSYYYLSDRTGAAREVDSYLQDGKGPVPEEVLRWLSDQFVEASNFAAAGKYLALLTKRDKPEPRDLRKLAQVQLKLQQFSESAQTMEAYLQGVQEPPSRALGLLDLARARLGQKDLAAAQKAIDESLTLQPEGKLSGEARILAGDVQAEQGQWDQAAKLYLSVAVILDEEDVTPRALEKAVLAYQKAGREPEAKKTLNTLQSRYPEYAQGKKLSATKP